MALNMSLKRVNKEIKDFNEKKYFSNYSQNVIEYFNNLNISLVYGDNNNVQQFIEITNKNSKKVLLILIVPNEYPFKPYNINSYYLSNNNDLNYSKYISKLNNKNKLHNNEVLKFFYKIQYNNNMQFLNLNNDACYCCASFNCISNWCAAYTFKNILLEYLELSFIDKYSKPYNYLVLENIYNQLFENYFNKLPNEIIEMIFNYMHI